MILVQVLVSYNYSSFSCIISDLLPFLQYHGFSKNWNEVTEEMLKTMHAGQM